MLPSPRTARPTTRIVAILAAMLLTLAPGAAHAQAGDVPTEPTSASIAAQLGGDIDPADIESVQTSPDGAHVLYRRTEHATPESDGVARAETGAPADPAADADPLRCSDVWVARLDGSATTRLSDVCESNPAYGAYTSNEQWSPDGAATYFAGMTGSHSAGVSHRWTATTSPGTMPDQWADATFRGAGTGYTPDGRFWILRARGWAYSTTEWTAVRIATGTTYPVWDEVRQSEGRWSAACRAAAAPQAAPLAPTFAEVLAAMTGSEPACGFVPRTQPAPSTDVATMPVRPSGPSAGLQVPLPETGVALPRPRAASASSTTASPLRTPPTPNLRIRSFTASIPAALDRGANVKFEARGAVSAKAWLIVEAHAARRSRSSSGTVKLLKPGTTIARGSVARLGIGVSTLPLRIDPSARRSMRNAGALRAYVRVVTTDATGAATKAERTVVLD